MVKKCGVCGQRPSLPNDKMCERCKSAFVRLYGEDGLTKAKTSTTEPMTMTTEPTPTEQPKPNRRIVQTTSSQIAAQTAAAAEPSTPPAPAPKPGKKRSKEESQEIINRNPRIAAKRITTCLKFLSRFKWDQMGDAGENVVSAMDALNETVPALKKLATERLATSPKGGGTPYRFDVGTPVQVKEKFRAIYDGVFELDGLAVVEQKRTMIVVAGADGEKMMIPAKHLEKVA